MGTILKSHIRKIWSHLANTQQFLKKQNISAAISEFENIGTTIHLVNEKLANDVYALVDKYSDVIANISNRTPATYDKFELEALKLVIAIIYFHLNEIDPKYKTIKVLSNQVINEAKKRNKQAFALAIMYSNELINISYKHGADLKYYCESLSYGGTDFSRLIQLVQDYTGNAIREAILNYIHSL